MNWYKRVEAWKPWIKLVECGNVWKILGEMPDSLRPLIAVALSVAKWHPSRGKMVGGGNCGLCIVYYKCASCIECPLCKKTGLKCDSGHALEGPESLWAITRKNKYGPKRYEAERKLYKILMDIYREEYEKWWVRIRSQRQ
jgi:hypothetical protein